MDKRPRCGAEGLGHGDMCVLRPHHEGDHLFQPKGQPRTAVKRWEQKPTLAKTTPKPGVPGQRDQRADPKRDEGDQRATRDDD